MTARTHVTLTLLLLIPLAAAGGEIAKSQIPIVGLSLEVPPSVESSVDIAFAVQTRFGGKIHEEAPAAVGMSVAGDLSGPGLDTPIRLVTQPGRAFQIPPLRVAGDYVLENVRLLGADGNFIQFAVPSFTTIHVKKILGTTVTVRQLTPDELRARGITIDDRNFDVYAFFTAVPFGEAVQPSRGEKPCPTFLLRSRRRPERSPRFTASSRRTRGACSDT